MKTENTLENKAKFFAQYWGQNILGNSNKGWKNWMITDVSLRNIVLAKSDYLELIPLSQISDEDAIEGLKHIKILGYSCFQYCVNNNYKKDQMVRYAKSMYSTLDPDRVSVDYLRSKGYALPFMKLSVEDLESYGWIKLKEEL